MKFITAKQFLKAEDRVIKAIMEWWEPSIYDLAYSSQGMQGMLSRVDGNRLSIASFNYIFYKADTIPLLTEGQLMEFIAYMIGCRFSLILSGNCEYAIVPSEFDKVFETDKSELLEALWDIAKEVA